MPRYRENPFIVKLSMLCPGKSQKHQLTLYKGQVWREKSYLELCNRNAINIAYNRFALYAEDIMEQNGELYVPPVPMIFISEESSILWDSEMLQSFAALTNTKITFESGTRYEIQVGGNKCKPLHTEQCVPPHSYLPWYIWTKEGLKIQMEIDIRFFDIIFTFSIF